VPSYPQTNLQLYNQLLKAGYSEDSLIEIEKAYRLAMNLFAGQYRPNGKTFIAHVVGTASILAAQRAPTPVVSAGLLHAAYSNGRFSDARSGITTIKRRRVRLAVGSDVEELVCKYFMMRWDPEEIRRLSERKSSPSADAQQVILIRLANEVDDHLDLGILYCSKDKTTELGINYNTVVDLAKKTGDSALADLLEDLLIETSSAQVPEALRRAEVSSFVINNLTLPWIAGSFTLSTFNYLFSFTRRTVNFLRVNMARVPRHGLIKKKGEH
jgi:(p)ppGpp synthase/HD superfamily hydrolase